ncbi:MAG: hypothetical protein ACLTZE_04520 [Evtepia sp.]|uniref:hypothetical protein n=1 Tax=Dysosmobacter sp. TaxID=2591382 RepID=UPI003A13C9D6
MKPGRLVIYPKNEQYAARIFRAACLLVRTVCPARAAPFPGQGPLAENWQDIGPSATVLQTAAWEEKVQKAYFETFTIIQTLLFLPGMLD